MYCLTRSWTWSQEANSQQCVTPSGLFVSPKLTVPPWIGLTTTNGNTSLKQTLKLQSMYYVVFYTYAQLPGVNWTWMDFNIYEPLLPLWSPNPAWVCVWGGVSVGVDVGVSVCVVLCLCVSFCVCVCGVCAHVYVCMWVHGWEADSGSNGGSTPVCVCVVLLLVVGGMLRCEVEMSQVNNTNV